MIQLAIFLTDFGDAGVVIPLSIAVALTLLLLRRTRLAAIWTSVMLSVWITMLLLKVAGYAMADVVPELRDQLGLVTASGHVAGAASAYGALAGMLAGPAKTAVRRSYLTALGFALLIGVTRVILHEHTPAEAVVGALVGIGGAVGFAVLAAEALTGRRRSVLLAAGAATLIVVHGAHLSLERTIAAGSARAVQTLRAE